MQFDTWFPVVIGISQCPFINDIQSKYKEIIKNYPSIAHGFINQSIHCKKGFKKLNDWITKEVNIFGENHKFPYKYEAKESWIWNYEAGAYQDYHCHFGFTISVVFYLEGYEEDTPIIFKNPINDMKNPLNTHPHTSSNANLYNSFTYKSCSYPPQSGKLFVWRSYLEHKVELKNNNQKRIVFVYNFDPK